MALTTKITTILAGKSLSDAVDCSNAVQIFLAMPPDWTSARLTFQYSPDAGANYYDTYEPDGSELAIPVVRGAVIRIDTMIANKGWIKLRSGSRRYPVPQEAARQFTLTIIS